MVETAVEVTFLDFFDDAATNPNASVKMCRKSASAASVLDFQSLALLRLMVVTVVWAFRRVHKVPAWSKGEETLVRTISVW